jgi:hypothetical protein
MADLNGFDATKVEPRGDYTPIPAGEYRAVITKSEKKPTKNGNGALLELTLEVIDGPMKGRTVRDRLNLWNPSQQASKIASETLSAICHATNVLQPKASEQLHNIPIVIGVAVEPRKDDPTKNTNAIKVYKKPGSVSAIVATAAKPQTEAEKAPWEVG